MEETKDPILVRAIVKVRNGTEHKFFFASSSEQAERDVINEVMKRYKEKILDEFHVERIGKVRVLG